MYNTFFSNTTPEQREFIRWRQKQLARQGYYPWAIPPYGFDKIRINKRPTLQLNNKGSSVVAAMCLITAGEIGSYDDAARFLTAAIGKEVNQAKAKDLLSRLNFKGLLLNEGKWIEGKFNPPVIPEQFDEVQTLMSKWEG